MTNEEKSLLRRAASIWGRLGGSARSTAKSAAARMNGKKGGRPGCFGCLAYTGNWPCKCGHVKADCPYLPSRALRSGGVQGAKSPRLKRAAEQSPRPRKGARPSKKKNA